MMKESDGAFTKCMYALLFIALNLKVFVIHQIFIIPIIKIDLLLLG